VVVLLLIPIAARELFSMLHYHNICVPDLMLDSLRSLEKVQNDKFCNVLFAEFSLCIAVISCNESNSFRLTIPKLIEFIAKSESTVAYEMIWIDQATADRVSLSRFYYFDKKFLFARPVGDLASFHLAFSQCTREYLFVLEENWLLVNMSFPWFSFSMDLLTHAPESMYAFLLCMIAKDDPIYRTTMQSCFVPSGTAWRLGRRPFPFIDGPAMYRMSSLGQIFGKRKYTAQAETAEQSRVLGYALSLWVDGINPPHALPIPFRRIGMHSTKCKTISICKGQIAD
jgi:hypothetical protein